MFFTARSFMPILVSSIRLAMFGGMGLLTSVKENELFILSECFEISSVISEEKRKIGQIDSEDLLFVRRDSDSHWVSRKSICQLVIRKANNGPSETGFIRAGMKVIYHESH
jgi:hypothetical protein